MAAFMGVTAFLSMWISNTATTAMMLPIAVATVKTIVGDDVNDAEENSVSSQPEVDQVKTNHFFFNSSGRLRRTLGTFCLNLLKITIFIFQTRNHLPCPDQNQFWLWICTSSGALSKVALPVGHHLEWHRPWLRRTWTWLTVSCWIGTVSASRLKHPEIPRLTLSLY